MKICFITGTRADYGLIIPIINEVKTRDGFELQLLVTGAHLSKEHGYTIEEIEKDGLVINEKVPMLEGQEDDNISIIKSMGRELLGMAEALERLKPDLAVIPGDRYEMLAAASACLIARIPIAHLYGGDVTEGAFDESIRHSITKMSQLHFATNEDSCIRIRQLGENPEAVFNVGAPSLDKIKTLKVMTQEELAENLKIKFRKKNLLITFHPETLADSPIESQTTEFLSALAEFGDDYSLIITMPNADPDGNKIRELLNRFAKGKDNVYLFESLGYKRYFSLMAQVDAVVGNSSSGLYEAPSFKVPTVNIGNRQNGRIMADSVVCCPCKKDEIITAIKKAVELDCSNVVNPYGDGNTSKRIVDAISKAKLSTIKKFYDIRNS